MFMEWHAENVFTFMTDITEVGLLKTVFITILDYKQTIMFN